MHEGAVAELRHQIELNRDAVGMRVAKETYETSIAELSKWRAGVDTFMTTIVSRGEGVSSTAKTSMFVLTAISILIAVFSSISAWKNDPKDVNEVARYNAGRLDALERQSASPVTVTNPPTNPVPTQQRP